MRQTRPVTQEEFDAFIAAYPHALEQRKVGAAMKRSLVEQERPVLGIIINQWRMKIGVMHTTCLPKKNVKKLLKLVNTKRLLYAKVVMVI